MPLQARQPFDFDEYIEREESDSLKHEFLDGSVWAMAGGSPRHAAIASRIGRLVGRALDGHRCEVFSSDLRVRVTETGLATYPDLSVICDRIELDPEDRHGHTATNPTLLVEVLSPSTEAYDRGEKLAHYKRIAALREVMLVAHDERRIDLWRRTPHGWTQLSFRAGEQVVLESLHGIEISVDDVYFDPLAS
ncbi:MAG: Uma2 family endonuclease [Nannocystaceae bacterium]